MRSPEQDLPPPPADDGADDGTAADSRATEGAAERAAALVRSAQAQAMGRVGPYDLLHAALATGDPSVLSAFAAALAAGVRMRDLREAVELLAAKRRSVPAAERALTAHAAEPQAGPELLVACVLAELDAADRANLAILDVDRAERLLRERARTLAQTPPPLFDQESGALVADHYTTEGWRILTQSGRLASELGYERILPPHCFLALLAEPGGGGITHRLVRLQCRPPVTPAHVLDTVTATFRLSQDGGDTPIPPRRETLGAPTLRLLRRARRRATAVGEARVGAEHLLGALLDEPTPRLASALAAKPISLDTDRMRDRLDRMLREPRQPTADPVGTTASDEIDRALSAAVVGQPEAVAVAVRELRRIRAGLPAPSGGAASVMLFTGLTGVGKSELARAIAALQAPSGRPFVYPMENFAEAHSLSELLGPPPGYAGHANGGRLVNDLTAAPEGVFLLDEAEKADPAVWGPFLHLFDQGTVTDRRGVTASGRRAVFVLTSNAGHEVISTLHGEGRPAREIALAVEQHLRTLRHPRTDTLVFPPELLARVGHIVTFRPLDERAMEGICRALLKERRRHWREHLGKDLQVDDALVRHIATLAHTANEAVDGVLGGRVVHRLVSELVEDAVTLTAEYRPDAYRECTRVEVVFEPQGSWVDVVFHREGAG